MSWVMMVRLEKKFKIIKRSEKNFVLKQQREYVIPCLFPVMVSLFTHCQSLSHWCDFILFIVLTEWFPFAMPCQSLYKLSDAHFPHCQSAIVKQKRFLETALPEYSPGTIHKSKNMCWVVLGTMLYWSVGTTVTKAHSLSGPFFTVSEARGLR